MVRLMKKINIIVSIIAAASLFGCTKVATVEEPLRPYTIKVASNETKTTNDGMHTLWATNDALSLLYAPAGTDPSSEFTNAKMTISSGVGTSFAEFSGDAKPSGPTDFYAIYPYNKSLKTPSNTSAGYIYIGNKNGVTQHGYDSMDHLSGTNCPMYGVALASSDVPSFTMKQLASVIEVDVTNSCSKSITITKVDVQSNVDLVGSYYIDFSGDKPAFTPSGDTYVSSIATVNVDGGTPLANGSTAKVYIPIKPHVHNAYRNLKIMISATVDGEDRMAAFEILPPSAAKRTFKAGQIKKVSVNVESLDPLPVLPDIKLPQSGSYSGTTSYPLSCPIENYTSGWDVTTICDGTVFTFVRWANDKLIYTIATNPGLARTGWFTIKISRGSVSMERTYTYSQGANPAFSGQVYTWEIASGQFNKDGGTVSVSDVTWAYPTASYIGMDSSTSARGLQIGSSNNPQTTAWTLSTSGISGTIVGVKVNACTGGSATIAISVGGQSYLEETPLTKDVTLYSGTGTSSGEIAITMKAESKAMYLKSVEITYK